MAPPAPTDSTLVRSASLWYDSTVDLPEVTVRADDIESKWFDRLDLSRWIPLATGVVLFIGIALRLRMYWFNRSLWFDETLLTLNILHRPFSELVPPLQYHQGAPFGFLVLEKAAVLAFGSSEYALRLVPLLAGIAALVLLYRLGRRMLPAPAALAAVGLFAFSVQQIGYSTDVKPYSMDTAVALLVTLTAIRAAETTRRRDLVILALTGAAAVWFSYPAAFVLAGTGICLAAAALSRRHWGNVGKLAVVGLAWTVSCVACYVETLRGVAQDTFVRDIWSAAFVPWDASYWTLEWIVDQTLGVFHAPVGMTLSGLGAFTFIAGWMAGDDQWRLRRWMLASPLAVAFAGAALHRYPFDGRFLNFAVPAILIVVSLGIARVASATGRTAPFVGLALVGLMFLHPLRDTAYLAARPTGFEEIRPVLDYVRQHEVAGDALYLYWRTEPAFAYYTERWKDDDRLPNAKIIHTHPGAPVASTSAGADRRAQDELDALEVMSWADKSALFLKDLDALRGQSRVWVVFYHVRVHDGIDEERWLRGQLEKLGKENDRIALPGASAYEYDLSAASVHQTG